MMEVIVIVVWLKVTYYFVNKIPNTVLSLELDLLIHGGLNIYVRVAQVVVGKKYFVEIEILNLDHAHISCWRLARKGGWSVWIILLRIYIIRNTGYTVTAWYRIAGIRSQVVIAKVSCTHTAKKAS